MTDLTIRVMPLAGDGVTHSPTEITAVRLVSALGGAWQCGVVQGLGEFRLRVVAEEGLERVRAVIDQAFLGAGLRDWTWAEVAAPE